MEIIRDEQSKEITFLYKLVPGCASSSWGSYCALMAGIPYHVVARGEFLQSNIYNCKILT